MKGGGGVQSQILNGVGVVYSSLVMVEEYRKLSHPKAEALKHVLI